MERKMELESSNLLTAISMMVNGSKVLKMEEECILMQLPKLFTVENGKKVKKMGRDTWNFRTKNITMEHSTKVWKKALELKYLWMETNTKDNTKMASSTEKESTLGQMVHATKVSLLMEFDKVKEVGNQQRIMEISTLELTKLIKRMDMEDMFGLMAAFMKVDSPMMSSKFSSI